MSIDDEKSQIQVICDEDFGLENFKNKGIEEAKNVTVIEIPAFRGGGGGGVPNLVHILFTGLSISFYLIAKGFFSEIGKDLAQSLLKKLKSRTKPCDIHITEPDGEVLVLVPADMSEIDCITLAEKLNEFITTLKSDRSTKVHLVYDRESGKLSVISIFEHIY